MCGCVDDNNIFIQYIVADFEKVLCSVASRFSAGHMQDFLNEVPTRAYRARTSHY